MPRSSLFSTPSDKPDRNRLLETLGRYSRFVSVSKGLLLLLTLLLLGTVVVLPMTRGDAGGMRIAFTATEETLPDSTPVMKNPRFQGTDAKNQPYLVTAATAVQQDKETIQLTSVSADMTFRDASWLLVKADEGSIGMSQKELLLIGHVTLFHDAGYEMQTERALIRLSKGEASGDRPLSGQGAMGHIDAAAFEVFDRGKRMVFHGPVRVTIQPGKK